MLESLFPLGWEMDLAVRSSLEYREEWDGGESKNGTSVQLVIANRILVVICQWYVLIKKKIQICKTDSHKMWSSTYIKS